MIAQRLVRVLCPQCKEAYLCDEYEQQLLAIEKPQTIYRAVGCSQCEHQGYKGRISVMELLKIDADLDELIARRASMREITTLAQSKGFRPIADDACRRVLAGETSLDEITRVIDLTDRVA